MREKIYKLIIALLLALLIVTAVTAQTPGPTGWYRKIFVPTYGRVEIVCIDSLLYLESEHGNTYKLRCIR